MENPLNVCGPFQEYAGLLLFLWVQNSPIPGKPSTLQKSIHWTASLPRAGRFPKLRKIIIAHF
jgi:hypothetical protein